MGIHPITFSNRLHYVFQGRTNCWFHSAASALPQVSQITDGQLQVPTAVPVSQISDGQIQGPAGSATTAKPSTASPFGTYSYPQEPSVNSAAVSSVASYAGIPAS